jgi:hypothetical protein
MRLAVLSFLSLLLITGCSKNNNNNTPSGSLSATVGSSSYTGTTTLGAYSSSLRLIAIVSYSIQVRDTSAFQIIIPYAPPVNRAFASDSMYLTYTAKGTEYDAFSARGQLQMTITSIDSIGHKIAGNFSAIAHDSTNFNDSLLITNGKFSTSYTVNP